MVSNGFIEVSEWFPFQSGAVSNGNSATFGLRSAAQRPGPRRCLEPWPQHLIARAQAVFIAVINCYDR